MSESDLNPMSAAERQRRGFCICPIRARRDRTPGDTHCTVHRDGLDLSDAQRTAASLMFFDDRRQCFVTWPDAVEAMRQGRYVGAANLALTLITWVNMMRLLETLHDPFGPPAAQLTEAQADALIAWAGAVIPVEERRGLLTVARGGGTPSICALFRMAAQSGQDAGARSAPRTTGATAAAGSAGTLR